MPGVKDILAEKGSHLFSVGEDATVLDAALLMNEHKIGALPVLREGKLMGMFTERDILQRIVAARKDPATTVVRDVMTSNITLCSVHATIDEARELMRGKRVRHLPILDDADKPVGMISIGDLNAWMLAHEKKTVVALQAYLNGES